MQILDNIASLNLALENFSCGDYDDCFIIITVLLLVNVFSTEDGSQRKPERQRVPMLAIGRSWEKGKRCLNRGWRHLVGCRRGDYARRATLGPLISGNESHGPRGRPLEYVYLLQNWPSIDP